MANILKNSDGTTLEGWFSENTTIDNGFNIAQGRMLQTSILTNLMKTEKYKLAYTCNELRSTNSYFLLTVGFGAGEYNTYFFPIQFLGFSEVPFPVSSIIQTIEFEIVGDLTVSDIGIETVSELSDTEKLALQKTSENSEYWDRIIDTTSNTGKLRAEMLEGLINTTLNRFANTSGTITQENGEIVFLNGTTPDDSTAAMKLSSVGLLIADTKNTDGSWHWDTAVTGAGISASAIVTGVLSAITINGVDIIASNITGGHMTGVVMEGNTAYFGDRSTGNYMSLTDDGSFLQMFYGGKAVLQAIADPYGGFFMKERGAESGTWVASKVSYYGEGNYAGIRSGKGIGLLSEGPNEIMIRNQSSKIIILPDGAVMIDTPSKPVYVYGDVDINGSLTVNGRNI